MASIGIYKIENKINGKVYIGQSIDIFKRWAVHANAKKSPKMVITKAILKYGVDKFNFEILELCDKTLLNQREIYWIDKCNSYNNGYNSTKGGDSSEFRESKIKDVTAKEIQEHLANAEYSKVELAKMYGVAESTIRSINEGITWQIVGQNYPIRVGYLKTNKGKLKVNSKVVVDKKVYTCTSCGINITAYSKSGMCASCKSRSMRKVEHPDKYTLIGKVLKYSGTALGKMYGVSDNAIRKWCKLYNIPRNRLGFRKLVWSPLCESNAS